MDDGRLTMRVEAQRAAPPSQSDRIKTTNNMTNIFVILLIVIWLCETSLRIDNSIGTGFT